MCEVSSDFKYLVAFDIGNVKGLAQIRIVNQNVHIETVSNQYWLVTTNGQVMEQLPYSYKYLQIT